MSPAFQGTDWGALDLCWETPELGRWSSLSKVKPSMMVAGGGTEVVCVCGGY